MPDFGPRFVLAMALAAGVTGAHGQIMASSQPPENSRPSDKPSAFPVAGLVRDSAGRPVAGATVVVALKVFPAQGEALAPDRQATTSGADGRFRTELNPHGASGERLMVTAQAFKEGLAPAAALYLETLKKPRPTGGRFAGMSAAMRRERGVFESEPPASPEEFVLVLEPAGPFVGTVLDQEGRPVPGARVEALGIRTHQPDGTVKVFQVGRDAPLDRYYAATSDAQGAFRFPALPQEARVMLQVTAPGFADVSTRGFGGPVPALNGHLAGTADDPAELRLVPEARVKGRVVTRMPGVGVGGLQAFLQPSGVTAPIFRPPVLTDAAGRFDMKGLPAGPANIFLINHPNAGPWTYRAIQDAALRPGETVEAEIELIPGVLVEGRVLEEGNDRPVPGTGVGLYGPPRPKSGAAIFYQETDAEGRYRFRVPSGTYLFYVSGPPRGHVVQPGDRSRLTVDVPEGPPDALFDVPSLRLARDDGG